MTPQERAEKSASAMMQNDETLRWMGMSLDSVGEGTAVMSMTVEKQHCNGHGITHGGMTFALADTAFAYACNSRNQVTVAQHNLISYLARGKLGDRLTATAVEVKAGRSGIYDVTVANQDGKVIAEFRGFSRSIEGTLFKEDE
ncbi:hydroxyphenylacetyl-CoA thioesterase PaaI [Marivivens sp. LCG002]|uniref:hydroxyphenylacetyl-CoA thioesterase PaaI n=1 Tax=Marivivens sp. LCG002 TaxID=3051171 RepID=UPI0025574AB8|nr:hydroxyphenylacetyl-CoA thioesterase PaaI [Marivivens sp. LCG002]WIV51222.1 hydroxyphenylacetyl-CoA thioesterase PaaI [Marivivens sp. LCG002]